MIEIDAAKGPYPLGMPPAKFLREYSEARGVVPGNDYARGRFQHRHRMATLCAHARCFQACRARADDHHVRRSAVQSPGQRGGVGQGAHHMRAFQLVEWQAARCRRGGGR